MNMKLLICFLVLLVPYEESLGAQDLPNLTIKDKSFSLTTKVRIGLESGETHVLRVEENYSRWQKRSKIQYETFNDQTDLHKDFELPNVGTFFVDNSNVLLFNRTIRTCKASSHDIISKFFQLDYLEEAVGYNEDANELYLAGPARILFFLERHKGQFTREEETGRTRNIPSFYYEFKHVTSEKMLTFYVHYPSLVELESSLPVRVLMNIPQDRDVSFDFTLNELISEVSGHQQTAEFSAESGQEPKFDQFSVEPAIGCSKLTEARRYEPFSFSSNKPLGFSFSALMSHTYQRYASVESELVVAYESSIDSLKVHKVSEARSTVSMTNFHLGRSYHITQFDGQGKQDPMLQRIFSVDSDQKQQSCVVATTPNSFDEHCPYSLSELISGSNESFVFLGYAQVRGIWTKAYEAYNSSLPVWLEVPVEYYIRARKPNWKEYFFNTIVYVASDDDHGDQQKPIMIDIHRLSALHLSKLSRTRVEVYDFHWSAEMASRTDNQRTVDFFSLADLCPASGLDNNHFGKVTMQLVSDKPPDSLHIMRSLQVPTSRNFALLEGIQSRFELPVTMVYDLQSDLEINQINEGDRVDSMKLSLTFQVAEHEKNLAELFAYGRGGPKGGDSSELLALKAPTFRSCFFTAAHRKRDTFFAYRANIETCLIETREEIYDEERQANSNSTKLMPRGFDIREKGLMEVYLIKHVEDITLPIKYDKMRLTAAGQEIVKYVRSSKKFELQVIDPSDGQFKSIPLSIASLELSKQLDKDDKYYLNGKLHDKDKFPGFGLVVSDTQNKLITPEKIALKNWASRSQLGQRTNDHDTEMTLELCQATCLSDFDCQSYSVCMENLQLECITSSVSFESTVMVMQLLEATKMAKGTREVSIDVGQQEVIHLRRRKSCQLHNKMHLDLFYDKSTVKQSITRRLIHPVTGLEECARKCFEMTIGVLRKDVDLINTEKTSKDLTSVINLFQQHQATISEVCDAFFYLSEMSFKSLSQNIQDKLMKRVIQGGDDDDLPIVSDANNYCIIGYRPNKAETDQLTQAIGVQVDEPSEYVDFDKFLFDFAIMFEKQYDIGLRSSPMSDEERAASSDIKRHGSRASGASFESISSLVERNDNLQVRISANERTCADICFGQSFSLWPGCKSFDITLRETGSSIQTDCRLNSMSMQDAIRLKRFDLIYDGQSNQSTGENYQGKVWHFEPKAGFISTEVDVARSYELNWWPKWAADLLNNKPNQIKSLGTFWAVLLASSCGLVLGVWLNRVRLEPSRSRYEDENSSNHLDTRYLVDSETVEFNNNQL